MIKGEEDALQEAEGEHAADAAMEVPAPGILSVAKTPARVDDSKALDITPACHANEAARCARAPWSRAWLVGL